MNIGYQIKKLRKQRGITQEQLANSIGVSFQAVSKWENNIALPDIALAPALARYFDVSMDVLFDYNLKEIEENVLAIAKESWKYRDTDWIHAYEILENGLKQYPDNDILLINLLYVIDYKETPDKTLEIASKVVDITKDESIKYDAYRFMAYAYKAKNDMVSASATLDQIPEIYFSRLSEKACILEGEEKWNAACKEEGQALYTLMLMKDKIAECHIEKGNLQDALNEYKQAMSILEIMNASTAWDSWRNKFNDNIENITGKLK